ncbi:hypothetical protein AB0B54_30510 [Microbispora bryophytorum]|uniref:hypothetical protein n=1 Tax=Microbispora bryophytorum TaxID=1460882 RepID=UPI0033FC7C89
MKAAAAEIEANTWAGAAAVAVAVAAGVAVAVAAGVAVAVAAGAVAGVVGMAAALGVALVAGLALDAAHAALEAAGAPRAALRAARAALNAAAHALRATASVGWFRSNPRGQGQWRGAGSRRLVRVACVLLPAGARERYREEWTSTVAEFGTRRARARFAISSARGVPRMAWDLRRKASGHRAVG